MLANVEHFAHSGGFLEINFSPERKEAHFRDRWIWGGKWQMGGCSTTTGSGINSMGFTAGLARSGISEGSSNPFFGAENVPFGKKKKKNNRTPPKIGKVKLRSPLQPKGLSGKLDVDDQAEATTQPTGVQWATKMPRNGFLGKKKRCHFDGGGGGGRRKPPGGSKNASFQPKNEA